MKTYYVHYNNQPNYNLYEVISTKLAKNVHTGEIEKISYLKEMGFKKYIEK